MTKKLADESYVLSADDAALCYKNHAMQTNSIADLIKLHQVKISRPKITELYGSTLGLQ